MSVQQLTILMSGASSTLKLKTLDKTNDRYNLDITLYQDKGGVPYGIYSGDSIFLVEITMLSSL